MFRIEFQHGQAVAFCDTAAEALQLMQGAGEPPRPMLSLVNGDARGSKSEAVRGFLAKFFNAKPREVVAALKLAGVSVTATTVGSVKTQLRKVGTKAKTRRGLKAKRA